ncbi:MAG: hypothetical protein CMG69_02800 [Candidatus Marinimicrobia bacterium]|nr:hypothetical protein [Candidatus Neomarinimicrobiota bacterium]
MNMKLMSFGLMASLTTLLLGESEPKLKVNSVVLMGVHTLNESELMSVIRTKPSSLFKNQYFDRRLVKFDAISLKTFCVSHGFLNSSVKDSIVIQDEMVNIFFKVIEGKQFILKAVEVLENVKLSNEKIKNILALDVSKPYNPIALNKNLPELKNEYQRYGKLFAEINIYEAIDDSAEVIIGIDEGKDIHVSSISIEGNKEIKHILVERELIFHQGRLYNKDEIDHSQRRLLETGIFSYAQITPSRDIGSDSTVHLSINIKQFKTREWQSVGGYYPIEYYEGAEPLPGAGAEFGWRNRSLNFTTTNFNFKLAGFLIPSQEYVYPKLSFNMGVGNQWIMKKRIPTQIGIFYEMFKNYGRQFDPFIARYGLKIVNQNNLSEHSYIHSELRWEKFYEEEDLEQRTYILNAFIDKTDHPIIPNAGYRMMGVFHLSGGILGGSKSFYKMDFGFNHYSKILSNYVFAGRYKLGKIFGWDSTINGDQQYDLFYLGGSSSLRGWDMLRFLTDSVGNPRGDTFRILVNWEVRFPLFGIFGGEVFIDGGFLSDTLNRQELNLFKWDGGFGITIATPLAPFRLDFAYPLDGINSWKMQMGANYIF